MFETTQMSGYGPWQQSTQTPNQFGPGAQPFGPQFGGGFTGQRLGELAHTRDVGDLVRAIVGARLQANGGRDLTFDVGDLVRAAVAARIQTGAPLLGGPGPDVGDVVRTVVGARMRGGMAGQSDIGDLVRGVLGARIQAGGPLLGGESDIGDLVRTVVGARIQAGGPLLDIGDLVRAIALASCVQHRQAMGQGGFGFQGGYGFGATH